MKTINYVMNMKVVKRNGQGPQDIVGILFLISGCEQMTINSFSKLAINQTIWWLE